ncbi:Na+/H+ antiporter subunit E [Pseudochrobactrum sp. sp1633]|uniref:Na+/H+ antiporter subunit E n=1 Tax=Pseudochrobactrum sp. sp1633 TaxID=3036706 RepID=UPI0025A573D4|nr:Na+/H+ antiporter subunit E [Pseudochrobactrum sp. sp1633]MDM8346652.1 Na+/H+ antiporter subunit E [Pseudochrobactrum sp. sp1633]HWD13970.1 Na+/H+ antiporter subunit E [Pseudochrobactrum sp.]
MRALFPHPVLSSSFWVMWLLLNGFTPGHAILGFFVAAGAGLAFTSLAPEPVRIGSVRAVVELFFRVVADIFWSNIAVCKIILANPKERQAGFVTISLQLRGRLPLAILACIVTSTPGTAWVNFNPATGVLLIHILDKEGEEEFRTVIKQHYERLLMEIFT